MSLYEILDLINDSAIVVIYDNEQNVIATYDGKEEIPEEFNDERINDIFPDQVTIGRKDHSIKVSAIGIEIDFSYGVDPSYYE